MSASVTDSTSPNQARLSELPNARTLLNLGQDGSQAGEPLPFQPRPRGEQPELPIREPSRAGDQVGTSFADLGHVLEQRSREWTAMVRQLDQHRQHLTFAQAEQDLVYEQLARIVPVVQDTYRSLKAAIEARESGTAGSGIEEMAAMNTRALEELEKIAGTLNAQAIWYRSAWEQYSHSAENAQRLRSQMEKAPNRG
jgi:hypothetical protein